MRLPYKVEDKKTSKNFDYLQGKVTGNVLLAPFQNNWANYQTVYGGGYAQLSIRRVFGMAHISGLIVRQVAVPAAGEVIVAIPQQFRPVLGVEILQCLHSGGPAIDGRVDVFANGNLVWQQGLNAIGGWQLIRGSWMCEK